MKTFSSFIVETRMTTHKEIVDAIAHYKKEGEILNPQFQDLKNQATRVMEKDGPDLLSLVKNWREDRNPDMMELYYTGFRSFVSHKKIEKLVTKLEKAKDPNHTDAIKAVRQYLKDWQPVGEDLNLLKGKVVKVTQKRAEAKAVAATEMGKKFSDSSSLIKIFESHLQEYKDMAETRAKQFVQDRLDFLKKHDWDLDKAVPRTRSYNDYKTTEQKRSLLSSLTKSKHASRRVGEPDIREPDQAKIDHYVKLNVQGAEDAYRSFMQKMIEKIGKPVVDAKMTGNIWTNATLTVTTNDGEQQVWETKMILNFSKYQKMFNQFPSRRKK